MLEIRFTTFAGMGDWQWRLHADDGQLLRDHEVRFDPSGEMFRAYTNLRTHLRFNASASIPGSTASDLLRKVGDWAGDVFFGPMLPLMVDRPGAIKITYSSSSAGVAELPLEACRHDARCLPEHRVTLVHQVPNARLTPAPKVVRHALRCLLVFPLAPDHRLLNLRRERIRLSNAIRMHAIRTGRSAVVRSLQYGVTRQALESTLRISPGWDVVHIAGHGSPGALWLEGPAGQPAQVLHMHELMQLLRLPATPPQLIFMNACEAAAPLSPISDSGVVSVVQLASEIEAQVVAMRYSVDDSFATDLSEQFYASLLRDVHDVPLALGHALERLSNPGASDPLASLAPTIIRSDGAPNDWFSPNAPTASLGSRLAVGTWLPLPFPRLVGRQLEMTTLLGVLSGEAQETGAIVHGAPGIGTTSLLLEAAHLTQDDFSHMVYVDLNEVTQGGSHPDVNRLIDSICQQIPRLEVPNGLLTEAALRQLLRQLNALAREEPVLCVLDRMDLLIADGGSFRDPHVSHVLEALTPQGRRSRLVLGGRGGSMHLIDFPGARSIHVIVRDLTLPEVSLLIREMPGLSALLTDETQRPELSGSTAREAASNFILATRGNPSLLEKGESLSSDPLALTTYTNELLGQPGPIPSGASDRSVPREAQEWSRSVYGALNRESRALLELIVSLEEGDRYLSFISLVWTWPQPSEESAAIAAVSRLLEPLANSGLLSLLSPSDGPFVHTTIGVQSNVEMYLRGQVTEREDYRQRAATLHLEFARRAYDAGAAQVSNMRQACMRAIPYLLERGEVRVFIAICQPLLSVDSSAGTALYLRSVATAYNLLDLGKGSPLDARDMTRLELRLRLLSGDWDIEDELRALFTSASRAAADGGLPECAFAAEVAADLWNLLMQSGRPGEALAVAEEGQRLGLRAELGPWNAAHDEAMVLTSRSVAEPGVALQLFRELLARIDELPPPEEQFAVNPTHVRIFAISGARNTAMMAGDYAALQEYAHAEIAMRQAGGASREELAMVEFCLYAPLVLADDFEGAERLLQHCELVLGAQTNWLGRIRIARGFLAARRGDHTVAETLLSDAAHLVYASGSLLDASQANVELSRLFEMTEGEGSPNSRGHLLLSYALRYIAYRGLSDGQTWRLDVPVSEVRSIMNDAQGFFERDEAPGLQGIGTILARYGEFRPPQRIIEDILTEELA